MLYVLAAFICLAITAVFPSRDDSQKNRRIEELSRDACALAWDSDGGKTARCVERVMAAMNDDQGARNSDLKRRLVQVERDLRLCESSRQGKGSKNET